jgi:hypothetical protein
VNAPRGLRAALLAGMLPVLLVACGDSGRNLKSYEPGVYKGARDPLVELQRTPEQQQKLRERFTKGQER